MYTKCTHTAMGHISVNGTRERSTMFASKFASEFAKLILKNN